MDWKQAALAVEVRSIPRRPPAAGARVHVHVCTCILSCSWASSRVRPLACIPSWARARGQVRNIPRLPELLAKLSTADEEAYRHNGRRMYERLLYTTYEFSPLHGRGVGCSGCAAARTDCPPPPPPPARRKGGRLPVAPELPRVLRKIQPAAELLGINMSADAVCGRTSYVGESGARDAFEGLMEVRPRACITRAGRHRTCILSCVHGTCILSCAWHVHPLMCTWRVHGTCRCSACDSNGRRRRSSHGPRRPPPPPPPRRLRARRRTKAAASSRSR